MILPPADAKDFFRIIQPLDAFLQSRLRMLKDTSPDEIKRLRAAGFADPAHFAAYANENPHHLTADELDEVQAWQQHSIAARFMVLQERKDGCLFMSSDKQPAVYLVHGLTQPISEIVPFLPCYVETRLLPWRGRIITDGLIAPIMVQFGGNMRTGFKQEAKEIIARRGLITTLPAGSAPATPDPAALLQHYLSTAASRRDCAREIKSLRRQSPALEIQYLQQMGKVNARPLKAALTAKHLTGHFAILEDTIIAGAPDKPTATACAHALVPAALRPGIVWLKV